MYGGGAIEFSTTTEIRSVTRRMTIRQNYSPFLSRLIVAENSSLVIHTFLVGAFE